MTRTLRNLRPTLATVVLAIIATGGLAVATSNGATNAAVSPVAASTTMLNPSVYGTGIGYDTKANIPVGPDGQKMAIKFKATTTSALNSVRFVQRGGAGYSLGTGGDDDNRASEPMTALATHRPPPWRSSPTPPGIQAEAGRSMIRYPSPVRQH